MPITGLATPSGNATQGAGLLVHEGTHATRIREGWDGGRIVEEAHAYHNEWTVLARLGDEQARTAIFVDDRGKARQRTVDELIEGFRQAGIF